jgi:outer membrane lipoprotein-sorting protein
MANLDHEGLSFQAQGDTTLSGTSYQRVRVEPPAGSAFTLHLNAETMRPERLTLQTTNPRSGQTVRVTQTFSDFQEVSGVTLPYKTETVQAVGEKEQTMTATIQSLEMNVDLEDGMFTMSSSSDGASSQ